MLVKDTFDEKELTPSQYKEVLTLLHKNGEWEAIWNWRSLTLLNSDYKIIAQILAERLKVVLPTLIHSDQKGLVILQPNLFNFNAMLWTIKCRLSSITVYFTFTVPELWPFFS